MAAGVYFKGGSLRNRETLALRRQMLITLGLLIGLLFPPHLLFILVSLGDYLKGYLGWPGGVLAAGLGVGGLATGLLARLILLNSRYSRVSAVMVRDDGFVLGDRLIRWADVDDVKVWSEAHVDAEVEGSPVVGYGMYGYAAPRRVRYERRNFEVVQIFHRSGVDEVQFAKSEFWSFVKAVLYATRASLPFMTGKNWIQKLEKLDSST